MTKHPYQEQVNKMWGLFEKQMKALEEGALLEAVALGYVLIEIELRVLLSSSAGNNGQPIPPEDIDEHQHLRGLAKDAERHGFIDATLLNQILDFNNARNKAIHGLAQGRIGYDDLESVAEQMPAIALAIQNKWCSVTLGPEESAPR